MLLFLFLIVAILIAWLSRPLDIYSIKVIGESKRLQDIRKHFGYESSNIYASSNMKKIWNECSAGEFTRVDVSMKTFPGIVGAFLYGKKNEWVLIAFASNLNVTMVWLRRGDRNRVSLGLDIEKIVSLAKELNSDSVIIIHNHPNPNARVYNCSKPSDVDILSAKRISCMLNPSGISLLEFVCERGVSYLFYLSPTRNLFPLEKYYQTIMSEVNNFAFINIVYRFKYLFFKSSPCGHYILEV